MTSTWSPRPSPSWWADERPTKSGSPPSIPLGSRMKWPWQRRSPDSDEGLATLVLGAGDAARELVRALQAVPAYGLRPIAFLDDNMRLGRVNGLPVLGELADLPAVAQSTGAKAALVAIPSLQPGRIAQLIQLPAGCGLPGRHPP